MNKRNQILLCACLLLAVPQARAQRLSHFAKSAQQTVQRYEEELGSLRQRIADSAPEVDSVKVSPYAFRLTGPGIYFSDATARQLDIDYSLPGQGGDAVLSDGMVLRDETDEAVSQMLLASYRSNPGSFRYYDSQVEKENIVTPAAVAGASTEDLNAIYDKVEEITNVADVVDEVGVSLNIQKPNFWDTSGKFSMQFTQNYFSENWYKGGNNNVTLLANIVLEAKYNDQRRVQWDNKLDMRLGFVTATSDSIHSYLTNNDKIYLMSKLGIKAAKSWFYTLSVEGNTQFMPGYKSNDRNIYSNFLAPLDVYVSLGMDWKPTLRNDNTFSLALLPLSYKMRYITAPDETIHKSYKMEDLDFQQDFGSKLELNTKLQIVKGLTWKCRFYYFTSYKYVESELENVLAFQFNKYISTEVYTLWRFDDNRSTDFFDDNLGFFQFKEYFTLGLSYNF